MTSCFAPYVARLPLPWPRAMSGLALGTGLSKYISFPKCISEFFDDRDSDSGLLLTGIAPPGSESPWNPCG